MMAPQLKLALSLSLGLHVGALVGLPALRTPLEFDVERAPTSLEIFIVSRPVAAVELPEIKLEEPEPAVEPEPAPTVPEKPEPPQKTLVSVERKGAITDLLPTYLRNPAPVYPLAARERGEEGTVVIEAEVLPSGACGQVRVVQTSGFGALDGAALKAVRGWIFKPATRWGKPASAAVEIPITFRLIEEQSLR